MAKFVRVRQSGFNTPVDESAWFYLNIDDVQKITVPSTGNSVTITLQSGVTQSAVVDVQELLVLLSASADSVVTLNPPA